MATITSLQIDLSARTARFSEGLQRAQQKVQQFSQRVQVDFQRVTQAGQRAALVFSGMTAALTLVTKRAADYASTMDKVASQTGIAVEQMQELAFAANQSNADLASLESGLRAFVRRTAEAAAGNASFLKGFERLGFTQEQVRAGLQDIDGFLMQVADRVSELGTTAEQSAVLMTIMGDAGRRLVPFMAQGARGIRELREQARELGLVMDEQAVRRLSAFNDRMEILQERTSAARREMAVWFLPAVEAGVGLFEDLIGAIQDIDPVLRAHAVRWTVVVGAVLGAVGVLGVLGTAVSQAGALLNAFGRVLSLIFSPMVIYAAIAIGAIALFRTAWENDWLGIRTTATEAWDNYIKPIWEALGEVWEWAIDIAGTAWEWLTETTWAEKVEDIKGWLTAGWEWLVDTAGSAWDWLVNTTWTEKIEDVRGWLKSAWEWTINLLGDAWAWIEEHLPWLATTIETLAGWLGEAWNWTLEKAGEAWDWLDEHAPAVTGTIRTLRDWLSDAWNWTINVLGDAWEWLTETTWAEKVEDIKGWLTSGWEWLVDVAGSAWSWLVDTSWSEKIEDVRGWLKSAWNWTINLLGDAWEWIEEHLPWLATTIETLAGWLSDAWNWTLEKAGEAWDWLDEHAPAVTNTVRNLRDWLSEAWDWTINVLGAGWEWLRNTDWAGIIDKVKQALSSAWDWTINVLGDAWEWLTETTWSEKVEDIKGWLTAGWQWAVDTAGTAWDWLTNTSWVDKVEDVRGWLSDAWDWTINLLGDAWAWIEEHLPWVAEAVETLHGLIAAGWDWTIRKAGDAWEVLEQGIPEELRELGRELGPVVVNVVFQPFGDLYEAIKRGLETGDWHGIWGVTADVWRRGIQIAVSLTLAIRSVQTVLSAIRSGLGVAAAGAATGLGIPGVLGTLSILVLLAEAREQGDYRKFGQDLIAALAAGIGIGVFTGSPYAGALAFTIVLNFEIGSWIGDKVGSLIDDIGSWIDDQLEPLQQPPIGQVTDIAGMYDALRASYMAEGRPAPHVPYGMSGDQLEVEIPATVYIEQVTGLADLGDQPEVEIPAVLSIEHQPEVEIPAVLSIEHQPEVEIPAVLRIEQVTGLTGLSDILRAIYVAEGGPAARVPYGATGFFDQGHKFRLEANQRRFEELVQSLNLVEGTEDYYAAAASVTVRHYWDVFRREFPEVGERTFAELAPEMQAMFIRFLGQFYAPLEAHPDNVNWIPNVLSGLGLSGYQSGTPWTGWGPTDEVAGVVHRREAVIPWDVLRRGPAAVLEFLGAPGFQSGYIPEDFDGITGATLVETEPDPGFIARLVESVVGGLESRGIIDPETARSLRELADNLLSIVGSLYDRAVELWDQLGQIDLGEYIDQARRFGEELEALGDVAEQERQAIRDRIDRLDDLVEIERLVAETTGQAFDETAFRAAELGRAITQVARQMFEAEESVEAILEVIAPWVEQLEPLQRQLEAQNAVATALERLAARLSEVDAGLAALVRSLRWEVGRGFRLDTAGLIQSAIGFVVELIVDLVDLFSSRAQELRQRLADLPDPGQDILSISDAFRRYSDLDRNIAERQRLLQDLHRQQQAVATRTAGGAAAGGLLGWLVGGPVGAAIGILLGGAGGRASAERDLGPQIEATERQIRELEAQIQGAVTDLINALGIAADDFAAGIAAAFQEADITDFGERLRESVRDSIRQAMIQAFVAQVLEPQITALAEMVQDAFLSGAPLDMEAIDAQIESIVDVSAQLYDRFEELGLTVERTNEAMGRFVRNIPSGYRVEQALFEVSPPRVPAMASGGIVTRPTLALVGEAGPEAVVPLDGRGFGTVNITVQRMEVQDGTDFGRRLDEELRRRGLVRAGNVTAWGGRR